MTDKWKKLIIDTLHLLSERNDNSSLEFAHGIGINLHNIYTIIIIIVPKFEIEYICLN